MKKSFAKKILLLAVVCLGYNTAASAQWVLKEVKPLGPNRGSTVVTPYYKGDYFASTSSVSVSATGWSKAHMETVQVQVPYSNPAQYYYYQSPSYPEATGSIGASWTVFYEWQGQEEPSVGTVLATATGSVTGSGDTFEGDGLASSSVSITTVNPYGAEGSTAESFYNKAPEGSVVFNEVEPDNVPPEDVALFKRLRQATMSASASAKAQAGGDPQTAEMNTKAKASSSFGPGRVP